ncbi:MAG: hypothetical protein COB30_006495 [Ectothiorhodospiraceae bacterium]|nr:hypothetical protein [Ectothiorhodospiraceae bacterium]
MSNLQTLRPPPDWATWLAQDADGTWWAFEVEPNEYDLGWYENELGRCQRLGEGAENPQWRETLCKLPTDR